MKRLFVIPLTMALLMGNGNAHAQNTPVSQMEKLNRGLVVLPSQSGAGRHISWRLLGTDADNITFDIVRDGTVIASGIKDKTNYQDDFGTKDAKYQIVAKVNGEVVDTSEEVTSWSNVYKTVQLDLPADGSDYTYSPSDASVGDVDGDGEYEIILKWDPSNSKDNSQAGKTGNVYLDCYKLDGTKLWRIDLGVNIRAGAHYTQFLVYDFDKDGKAELICKTAPGSKDGAGQYVNKAATDNTILQHSNSLEYRDDNGRIMNGPEYLTVFEGLTGKAIHTIWYNPNRAGDFNKTGAYPSDKGFWGDNYANRSERYLATVAYLDGPEQKPSAVMARGYYTRAYLWAVDFDGSQLKTKWLHASTSSTVATVYGPTLAKISSKTYSKNTANLSSSKTAYGNGNHNLSCGDVDGDGCDEIIWGSCAINNDGSLLYATGYGHGDAIHFSDLIPDRPGLEVFQVHEDKNVGYGWDVHDAATGEILLSSTGSSDNGRGMSGDIVPDTRGFEFWSANDRSPRSATTGEVACTKNPSINFRMYWDDDPLDEILDGNSLTKYNNGSLTTIKPTTGSNFADLGNSSTCNGTKNTPNFMGDILGDWREELILWNGSTRNQLNIFSSNVPTELAVPTLPHDHIYRMGMAWQNVAYNQPPHLGYYLSDRFKTQFINVGEGEKTQTVALGDSMVTVVCEYKYCGLPSVAKTIDPNGTEKKIMPTGFKFTRTSSTKHYTVSGKPEMVGTYTLIIKGGKNVADNSIAYDTITVNCVDPTAIIEISNDNKATGNNNEVIAVYDASGRKVDSTSHLPTGTYMVRMKTNEGITTRKVIIK